MFVFHFREGSQLITQRSQRELDQTTNILMLLPAKAQLGCLVWSAVLRGGECVAVLTFVLTKEIFMLSE